MTGIRFWPPEVPLTPDVRWVLERSFCSEDLWSPFRGVPHRTLSIAISTGLLTRIRSRVPSDRLSGDMGGVYESLLPRFRIESARSLALRSALQTIDEIGSLLCSEYVLLKGAALDVLGVAQFAQRGSCDIDVLVPEDRAIEFQNQLMGRGFRQEAQLRPVYHLPVLRDHLGCVIEVHTHIPNVVINAPRERTTVSILKRGGLLLACRESKGYGFTPLKKLILAQCIGHGIVHHGFIPLSYPLMKMLLDVTLLVECDNWSQDVQVRKWLTGEVGIDEIAAIELGCRKLRNVDLDDAWYGNSPECRLLRHAVIGSIDENYARGLVPHHVFFHRRAQLRAMGLGQFISEVTHRLGTRIRARTQMSSSEYSRHFGSLARGNDFAEFRMSSLLSTGRTLFRQLAG